MTTPTEAAKAAEQDPINAAILLLTEEADSISDCHTRTPGDWAGEPEAKAHYDHVRSVVDALSKLRAPVADERAAFARAITGRDDLEPHQVENVIDANLTRWTTWRAARDYYQQARAALASAPVAPAEVMDALNWVDDFIARCNRDDRGSCDSVNVLRRALAGAPVDDAGNWQQYRLRGSNETAEQIIERERTAYADLLQSVMDKRRERASAPVAVPPGWKLVPIEPTPEMEDAGCDVPCPQDGSPPPSTVYAAMIGAAPPAPEASAPVAGEAQPFMYGIMGPDGKAHFEEFCVSGDHSELQAEVVDHLNRDNPEDRPYSVVALFRDAAPQASAEAFDFVAHLTRQAEFSARTFGPGARVAGVCDHIRKELIEVETSGGDLKEWVDVIILGLDGAWRSGATPQEIIAAIVAKQAKNEARTWPDWRTVDPNKAIEHQRTAAPCTCPSGDGSLRHPCHAHPQGKPAATTDEGQQ